jgi:DNA-binding winged helix-turn-helix (wHTH) protein
MNRAVTFGDYRLDVEARQLSRGRAEIHISPKAFDLLRLLVDAYPRALSRAQLQQSLWPSTFVSEGNLASLIAELRRALDDEAAAPRYIRTVHRFGYRFCYSLDGHSADDEGASVCFLVWRDRVIKLVPGANLIGRDPRAAVHLDLPSVSRRHASITVTSDTVTVEDLGSRNGTFVGDNKVTAAVVLEDRNELQVGSARMVFRREAGNTSTVALDRSV